MTSVAEAGEILPKAYDPTEVEARWYAIWDSAQVFRAEAADTLEGGCAPYVIMMPPPNVTGTLHNGHALFVALQDILIRYHRMKGRNTLWLPGVDHAGIATQAVVERELLRKEGHTRHEIGREAFMERVWDWKERNGDRIVEQLKVLGASADWSKQRFTMDSQCSRAVVEAFVRLWEEGLIYRGERLINWDPTIRTALSNEEVEYEDREGELWRFAYPLRDPPPEGPHEIVVATTRPETMLGDTGVAVHPEDERYAGVVGKSLRHPWFPEREIRVVADPIVDPEFGTGAVKVTPAHDPNDFDIGTRHGLEFVNIFGLDAHINENGGPFRGLGRYEARAKVKAELEALGLSRGGETITHAVAVSQRSNEAVEPMLSRQYFVRVAQMAQKACKAVDDGETRIIPASWKASWDHFMNNLKDWCISRQLWWGHRIPVYYDLGGLELAVREDARRKGGTSSALEALESGAPRPEILRLALDTLDEDLVRGFSQATRENPCDGPDGDRWVQEEDVLDTWFSAGLWPISTLGWPDATDDLKAFYPGAVLETGFDILFFWVARMMMFGCHFMGKAPFSDVFLHALVRDSHGRKMSKSLGNAIDPLDVIHGISLEALTEKTRTYPVPESLLSAVLDGLATEFPDGIPASGADGLRFSLAALSGQGRDIKLSIPRVAGYRAFLNKIWNATRFALMKGGTEAPGELDGYRDRLSLADRWILSRLQAAVQRVSQGIESYRFDEAANGVYQFFWSEFCDWYIELSKDALSQDSDPRQREATRSVLTHVLDASMRLLHPICPFQSEEIWQRLPGRAERWGESAPFCAVAPFPEFDEGLRDDAAELDLDRVIRTVTGLRRLRQESRLPSRQKIAAVLLSEDEDVRAVLSSMHASVCRLAGLGEFRVLAPEAYEVPRQAAVHSEADLQVVLPLEGLIDLEAERERLEKDLKKARKELESHEGRLANEKYVTGAPAAVVQQTRDRAAACRERIQGLESSLERLSAG